MTKVKIPSFSSLARAIGLQAQLVVELRNRGNRPAEFIFSEKQLRALIVKHEGRTLDSLLHLMTPPELMHAFAPTCVLRHGDTA